MNKEQIEKLKALAQAAENEVIRSHGWAGSVEMLETLRIDEEYLTAASPAAILELISFAERSLSAQDEVLTDDDLTQEFSLDAIIKGIRYSDHGRHEGWQAELKEYIRIECTRALLAAAPSPAVAVEPVGKMVCPICGKDRFKEPCPNMADECPMVADAHLLAPPALAGSQVQAAGDAPMSSEDWIRELYGDGEAGAGEED